MTGKATATVRQAGENFIHTVTDWHGEVVGTRRSAHRYRYAICRRGLGRDRPYLVVVRWSRSARCSSTEFPLEVT